MHIHVILVNPARGEHVGFVARAIKTMGLDSLRLVGKELQNSDAARKTGYGSHEVLDQVKIFPKLEKAVEDLDLVIGTTSKARVKRFDPHPPSRILEIVRSKQGAMRNLGLVFGTEESGLSTKELDLCDLISTIPMATGYPSLNLSQSVLIYAWELRKTKPKPKKTSASTALQARLKTEAMELLEQLGYGRRPLMSQRIMDRLLLLNKGDMELLMALLNKLKDRAQYKTPKDLDKGSGEV